jgi:hypothetical protein
MIELPKKITVANNPTRQALKYFLPIVATFWVTSFALSSDIANGALISISSVSLCTLIIVFVYKKDKKTKRSIELSNEGLSEIKNGVNTFISWNENHQTYYDGTQFSYGGIIPVGTIAHTQIVAAGKRIRVDYPQNQFHESILTLSFKHVFPLIIKQLEEGKRVYFGPIELDKEHIYLKQKPYAIKLIKKVKVENGKLILHLNDHWLSTKMMVRDIPNLSSLLKFIETV